MFRNDAGVEANTLPLVDETEVLETLALELLVDLAFLAENVPDEQSNMGAHFVSQCFVVICVGLLPVIALRILVVAFLVFNLRILRVDLLTHNLRKHRGGVLVGLSKER